MRVFNLTESPLDFRGRVIPADGGFLDYPELDTFVPNRDLALVSSGVIAFNVIPSSWHSKKAARILEKAKAQTSKKVTLSLQDSVSPPTDSVRVSAAPWKKHKR